MKKNVEDVDVIWNEGRLHERFTPSDLGRYDAVIASHVVEHLPNPLAFFQSCESLLKPRGRIVLALPDKRRCFDFFGNISTTGDILENYLNARTTHTARAAFNDAAYAVRNGGAIGWGPGQIENLEFVHPFDRAIGVAKRSQRVPAQYFDHHAWRFVPSSFSLIILELQMMGLINLRIVRISDTMTQEFFVEIAGDQLPLPSTEELANRRLALLKENLRSVSLQVQELGE